MLLHLKKPHLTVALAGLAAAGLSGVATVATYEVGPIPPAVVAASLAALALALLRPMAVLLLAIVAIPLELQSVPIGEATRVTPTIALLVLAAFGWSLQRMATGRLPLDAESPLTKPYALLLLAVLPGFVIVEDKTLVIKLLAVWVLLFLLYQMVVVDGDAKAVRNILIAIALAGAIAGAIAIVDPRAGAPPGVPSAADDNRAYGPFTSPNFLGVLLALSLPAAVALAVGASALWRAAGLAAFGLALYGLALTQSRAAQLGAVAALLVMLSWTPFRRAATLALITVLVILLGAAIPANTLPVLKQVEARFETLPLTWGANPRWEVWNDALEQLASNPVFGVGAKSFESRTLGTESPDAAFTRASATGDPYGRAPPQTHNLALGIAVQLGLVGLAALVWAFAALARVTVGACRHLRGTHRRWAFAVAASLTVVFVEGLLDDPTSANVLTALIVILSGCAVVLWTAARQPTEPAAATETPLPGRL